MKESGNIVDIAIDALGLGTQTELAERCGVARQEISRWRGMNRITARSLIEILRQLHEERLPDGSRRAIPRVLWYADLDPQDSSRQAASE